jgi:hypothetical protein
MTADIVQRVPGVSGGGAALSDKGRDPMVTRKCGW